LRQEGNGGEGRTRGGGRWKGEERVEWEGGKRKLGE